MVRNKLTQKQAITIVTAQIFSILYYASCVWPVPSLNRKTYCIVESMHYRALRLIIRDYRQKVSRETVTVKTKRLTPDKWARFALASLYLNMYNRKEPKTLLREASANCYTKRRKRGYIYSYDSSKTKIGKQMTKNWIGSALGEITNPWCDQSLSKDSVRVLLKKSFYKM